MKKYFDMKIIVSSSIGFALGSLVVLPTIAIARARTGV